MRAAASRVGTAPCRYGWPAARVTQQQRYVRIEVEGQPYLVRLVPACALETVHGHDERRAAPLEVVHRREAGREPPGVGEHDRPDRAQRQLVPQEPEAVLS